MPAGCRNRETSWRIFKQILFPFVLLKRASSLWAQHSLHRSEIGLVFIFTTIVFFPSVWECQATLQLCFVTAKVGVLMEKGPNFLSISACSVRSLQVHVLVVYYQISSCAYEFEVAWHACRLLELWILLMYFCTDSLSFCNIEES